MQQHMPNKIEERILFQYKSDHFTTRYYTGQNIYERQFEDRRRSDWSKIHPCDIFTKNQQKMER